MYNMQFSTMSIQLLVMAIAVAALAGLAIIPGMAGDA